MNFIGISNKIKSYLDENFKIKMIFY